MRRLLNLASLVALVVVVLTSCAHETLEESVGGRTSPRFSAGIATRADGGFWTADKIGVMVTDAPDSDMDSEYVNVAYETSSTGTTADFEPVGEKIYFEDADETVTFAAYAPYSDSGDIATLPGTDGKISGDTSSQSDSDAQTALDHLYADGEEASKSDPDVTFAFTHVMSKIVIELSADEDNFEGSDIAGGVYTLGGLVHEGEFDVNPGSDKVGTAYATGASAEDDWTISDKAVKSTDSGDCDLTLTAIVYPQTPGSLDIAAKIRGMDIAGLDLLSAVTGGDLEAGKSYTFKITVSPAGLVLKGCTVADWTTSSIPGGTIAYPKEAMVLTYTITSSNTVIKLPLYGSVDCTVDWGDGSSLESVTSSNPSHTYVNAGEYDVVIKGTVTQLSSYPIRNDNSVNLLTAVRQWGLTGLVSMENAFINCNYLASVPADEYGAFAEVTTFYQAFCGYLTLTSIEGLLDYCSKVTNFEWAFSGISCPIPSGLFDNCTSATNFASTFRWSFFECEIPAGLFDNCPLATTFYYTFDEDGVTSIPEGLFVNCPNVTDFEGVFRDNNHITEIPGNLFAVDSRATNFEEAFTMCENLVSIPEGLFDNCPDATNFARAFYDCKALTSIPEDLFKNNTKVTNFTSTFYGCTSLTGKSAHDVIDGADVYLYQRSDYPSTYTTPTNYSGCYSGCSGLDDYSNIPSSWK